MKRFEYFCARDLKAALQMYATYPNSRFIAGGTDILNLMKESIETPTALIDINPLNLTCIEETAAGVSIGALARLSDVAANMHIRQEYPAITQALEASASAQIRNMATIGGNLLQRTRCPYFRADTLLPCNKRNPGSGCAARHKHGYTRSQAIFGWTDLCCATHPSDVAVALVALDAQVQVCSLNGERTIKMCDFYRLPYEAPERDTILEADEIITHVHIPASSLAAYSTYLKVRERTSYEFAVVSVAAALELHETHIHAARIVLGGVASIPWRLRVVEQALVGGPFTVDTLKTALTSAFREARPLRDNNFKVEIAQQAILQTLQYAGGEA
jgi:xanthine dehydrogenase YagS FAD-binding subunit